MAGGQRTRVHEQQGRDRTSQVRPCSVPCGDAQARVRGRPRDESGLISCNMRALTWRAHSHPHTCVTRVSVRAVCMSALDLLCARVRVSSVCVCPHTVL